MASGQNFDLPPQLDLAASNYFVTAAAIAVVAFGCCDVGSRASSQLSAAAVIAARN